MASNDEHAATLLREPVIRGIDYAPLDFVPESSETGQHDCEVTATLVDRRFQQSINVLKEEMPRSEQRQPALNLPPKHALESLDSFSLTQGFGDRVVLARESAHKEVVAPWDPLTERTALQVGIYDCADVGVDANARKVALVALERVLRGGSGFPLVGPDNGHSGSMKAKMKATYASE
jgi:hypothetical protein